jgi:hypothetical protein
MKVPENYDPITLNHWLWWKLKCFEASGEEFQRLFEETMLRTDTDFARIRPYGNSGDKKSDGILVADDTIYQVYSPDEYKQINLRRKVTTDLAGAVTNWPNMREWVFVYNVRRGLAPDIGIELTAAKALYPRIALRHMSSDHLWERLRGLDLQARSEVLGAPSGYEHFFLASGELRHELVEKGRFVLIHDLLSPIDHTAAVDALREDGCELFGPPLRVAPSMADGWEAAATFQDELVGCAIERSRHLRPRFAVFCMSPIPLAIHLGYLLSDRVQVEMFQWDRDGATWSWGFGRQGTVTTTGIPQQDVDAEDAQIRVSISAPVRREDCLLFTGHLTLDVEVRADVPDVQWLQQPEQIATVCKAFRTVLAALRARAPALKRIHVFAAVPAGVAVGLGRTVNPRMNPPVELYEFDSRKEPKYERVLTLI